MKLIRELSSLPSFPTSTVVTIGNFDGMHRGHQAVIKRLVETAKSLDQPSLVLSFENHPAEVLKPNISICRICSTEYKIQLMKELGVDLLVLLTFTKEFAEQTAEEFLQGLQKILPFSNLIFGWDTTLGKNKHGNKEIVQAIAKKNAFLVEYLEPQKIDDEAISSSQIRKFIQEGKLDKVHTLLGRSYSIYSPVYKGEGKGKKLGFPTANMHVKGLCLPPLGVYAITSIIDGKAYKGVANLGIAPTMREDKIPILEVHLFDFTSDLYDKFLDVRFSQFLRPEKKFSSLDELKSQINSDIIKAKNIVN